MMRVGPLASGMIVVAEFPQDKKKYRAKVVEVLTPKSIRVYFIDYGNECNVPWTNVFKLPDTFLQEPEMVSPKDTSHRLALHHTHAGMKRQKFPPGKMGCI